MPTPFSLCYEIWKAQCKMNPLQVTNLCSTRRHVACAVTTAKAIQIEAGDHRLRLRRSGSSLRSCCTFHCWSALFHGGRRRQSAVGSLVAGLLLQQMPVAQMPDIKGKSSAQDSTARLESTRFGMLPACLPRNQWNWSISWSTLASRCINKISYIYRRYTDILYAIRYASLFATVRGEIESNCHLFSAWKRKKCVPVFEVRIEGAFAMKVGLSWCWKVRLECGECRMHRKRRLKANQLINFAAFSLICKGFLSCKWG